MISPDQAIVVCVVLLAGIALLAALRGGPDDESTTVEPAQLILEEEQEVTRDYTTHTAVAEFENGEEKEYTFDGMKHKNDRIILCDYTGIRTDAFSLGRGPYLGKEATTTISKHTLIDFETTDREKNEFTTTRTKEITVDPEEAVELLKEDPDNFEYKGVHLP